MANCVGHYNYKYFYLFLFYTFSLCVFGVILTFGPFMKLMGKAGGMVSDFMMAINCSGKKEKRERERREREERMSE